MEKTERRRSPRKALGCEVTLRNALSGMEFQGFAKDVSTVGIYVETDGDFVKGDFVNLVFRLPEGTTYVEASGMVVRKEEIGEGKYGLGVEFVEMEEWVLSQIWHFVMHGK